LPVEGSDERKQTNEIGMFVPLLDAIEIKDKLITADALLTQRKLADYVVQRGAHYHFTAKGNQATLQNDITLLFQDRKAPHFVEVTPPDHGRIETRRIWCSEALNGYLDFPHVGQVFLIEREVFHKKSARHSMEIAAAFEQATVRRTSHGYAALPWVYSTSLATRKPASLKKWPSSTATPAWSLITCA